MHATRREGSVLGGRWVLGRALGAGGTSTVYEGTHRTNGKRVAVKVLHRHLASSPDVVERFAREGAIANHVDHPGAVAVLDDDVAPDGAPYLVMERLEGRSLSQLLAPGGGGIGAELVLVVAHGVLDVLVAAHARGVVHRDVKPDNVFVTASGRIKLLDFGLACLRGRAGATLVEPRAALGTPQYMPPEQARGAWGAVDAQSDVWAVGATMFRLLAGRPPRTPGGPGAVLQRAASEPVPRLADVAPGVPADVAAIVDRATRIDKRDRWPDARAMRDATARAAAARGVALDPPAPVPTGAWRAGLAASRGRRAGVVALTALALSSGLAIALVPDRSDRAPRAAAATSPSLVRLAIEARAALHRSLGRKVGRIGPGP